MKEIIINHFFDFEFVYIFFFCSLIFLLISIFIKKKTIRKISILCFSLFFVLFGFEFGLSFFMAKMKLGWHFDCSNNKIDNTIKKIEEVSFINDKNIKVMYMKEISFINDQNIKVKCRDADITFIDPKKIVYNVCYSQFSNHFRYTNCNKKSDQVYIFLGCSFTFGDGLNDDETLPYFFSKKFNFEKNVINCGARGHSSNTALNILNNELFLPLIKSKDSKIKHCFYSLIEDQLYRNFRYEGNSMDGLIYKNEKWCIPTTIGKIKYIFARSYIFRKIFVPVIDEKFKQYYEDYMIKSLKEMNKIVEEKYNSKLTIIVWSEDYSNNFIRKLKEINLDLIFLPEYFTKEGGYKIKNDSHPTAKANEELAQILYNHINEKIK